MEDITLNLGDIVYSKAGRDMNRHYIVMRIAEPYIWTCDGDLHKVEKFKKKKIKHTKYMGHQSEYIKNKLEGGEKVTNSEIRRALAEFESEKGEASPLKEGSVE